MQAILDIVSHTPFYVYPLFAYLIFAGWNASKDRVISFYKIAIVTGIFILLSAHTIKKMNLGYYNYLLLLSVFVPCCFFGWLQVVKKKILIDKRKMLIALPGSWMTLALVLLIFFTKYYMGYKSFQDFSFIFSQKAALLTIFTSGLSSGILIGRFMNYLYRLKFDTHIQLSQKNELPG